MAGRDLFGNDPELQKPPTTDPSAGPRDLFGDDPDLQRRQKLKAAALASLQRQGDPGAMQRFLDSYTLGLRGPVSGLATGLGNALTGQSSFGEGYTAGEEAYDEYMKQAEEKGGTAGTIAGVAGSLLTGRPGAGGVTIPGMIGGGAALSGVESGARARGDVSERATEAAGGAAIGGTIAGALGGITRLPFRQRLREIRRGPGPDEIRGGSRAAYDALDNAGATYDRNTFGGLTRSIRQGLRDAGGSSPAMDRLLGNMETRGTPMSGNGGSIPLSQLQAWRDTAGDLSRSADPNDRRLAGVVLGHIDDFVRQSAPSQGTMTPEQLAETWQTARQGWRTANRVDDMSHLMASTERNAASANSGQNVENTLRRKVASVANKAEAPRSYNPFNEAEIAAMDQVARGTVPQNMLRSFGNTFGGSGVAPLASVGVPAISLSQFGVDPTTAAAIGGAGWLAGRGARHISTNMAQNSMDDLVRLIATGNPQGPTVAAAARQAMGEAQGPTRAALARMIEAGVIPRTAAAATSPMMEELR